MVARRSTGYFLSVLVAVVVATVWASGRVVASAPESVATTGPRVGVVLLLDAPPVAEVYAARRAAQVAAAGEVDTAALATITQAHLAALEQAQSVVVAALEAYDATLLYQVQRVYNGIAVHAPPDRVAALAELPGVVAVAPILPKEPSNARAGALVGAPILWRATTERAGLTGEGVTIAIIDTGIDYLHTMFGGSGNGYHRNDPTVIGDVPDFPNAKVIGGYDFAGDTYNANPASGAYQPIPQPDPDPMDCYGFGHGTHVAGTAAGYGVTATGATYTGSYDEALDLNAFRIAPGVAPRAQLYALKVFGCAGSSEIVDMAVEWALDPNGDGDLSDAVDILNLSLGSPYGALFDSTALAVENATKAGVIVVTSAGNSGDVHYAVSSPGIIGGALAVAATVGLGDSSPDLPATFSARGPRRGDSLLKPDIAAPGVSLFSAARGTGSHGTYSSGTSMAAPVVTGAVALLRERYPATSGWRNDEIKALVMNTAHIALRDSQGRAFSLTRTGAGRINLVDAVQSALIAYDAERPHQVSVSFGVVDIAEHVTLVRYVRIANKSSRPITVTVGYESVRELPGVEIVVEDGHMITVPPYGFAGTPVTLRADAAAMTRQPDLTRQASAPFSLAWVDEASGYLTLTPATEPRLHVPIYAAPRPLAELSLTPALDFGDALTATATLTATGIDLATATPPTGVVSILGLFDLRYRSVPITAVPNGDPVTARYAHADLQAIGVFGPFALPAEPFLDDVADLRLHFAPATYGAWSTPLEVTFRIELDTSGNGRADYILSNRSAGYVTYDGFLTQDRFVAVLEAADGSGRRIQGPLNGLRNDQADTRPFNTNVMVLPLRLRDLGDFQHSRLRYRVVTFSRDVSTQQTPNLAVDATPWLLLDWTNGVGITWWVEGEPIQGALPLQAGTHLVGVYDRAAYQAFGSQGLVAFHYHNPSHRRVQLIRVDPAAPPPEPVLPRVLLPWVSRP